MTKPAEARYGDLRIGDHASFAVDITDDLVAQFAQLSGDWNPLHMDKLYGKTTPFGTRIPHGMIAGTLFSRLIGMHLPGKYSLYLSQTLRFRSPLVIGSRVVVQGSIIAKADSMMTATVQTTVASLTDGAPLVEGEAIVKLLQ